MSLPKKLIISGSYSDNLTGLITAIGVLKANVLRIEEAATDHRFYFEPLACSDITDSKSYTDVQVSFNTKMQ